MSGGSGNAGEGRYNDALQQFANIDVPTVGDESVNLQKQQNTGDLQNQMEQTFQMGPSAMQGVQVDPRLAQAQMSALNQLSQTGQTGMTPAQAAALQEAQRQAASQTQAKSSQLEDEFARRGMGGSGAELAARLSASQQGADLASQNSNATMQMAQQNALAAMGQSGALAGQMSGQQFGQQQAIAQAKDYINQFNTQNQQSIAGQNTNSANQANAYNVQNAQQIGNSNANIGNQQAMYNAGMVQQNYQNQMSKAGAMAGISTGLGQLQSQNNHYDSQAQGQMMGNVIGGAAQIGGAAMMSDEKLKTDVKHFDASSFLDKLVPSEYKYKDPSHGDGKQVGVMAQDVEKDAPQLVGHNEKGDKYIDYNKAGGPILASLAALHERLNKLEGGKNG